MNSPAKILKALKKAKKILIPLHINIDGDSIGSSLALYQLLKSWSKDVAVVTADPPPANLLFLPGAKEIRKSDPADLDLTQYDLLAALDNASLSRFSRQENFKIPPRLTIINIDHHPTNESFGDLNYVVIQESSTAEILYGLMKGWNLRISKDVALCLLTGIFTDTGGFQYESTTPESMERAAALIRLGANHPAVINNLLRSWSPAAVSLWTKILENLKIQNRFVYSTLTQREIRRTAIEQQELNAARSFALHYFLRAVKDTGVSALFNEEPKGWSRCSLRSRSEFDVAAVAKKMGGGGHNMSAGFITKGKLREVVDETIGLIKEALK